MYERTIRGGPELDADAAIDATVGPQLLRQTPWRVDVDDAQAHEADLVWVLLVLLLGLAGP